MLKGSVALRATLPWSSQILYLSPMFRPTCASVVLLSVFRGGRKEAKSCASARFENFQVPLPRTLHHTVRMEGSVAVNIPVRLLASVRLYEMLPPSDDVS